MRPRCWGRGPEGYGYGTLWTKAQIESALAGQGAVCHVDEDGHGSHVSGTAVGNGAAVGRFAGMAPEADIIVVADDPWAETSMVDAAGFIYRIAQERGQPVVINLSAGTHFGPHDDSSLEVRALNNLVTDVEGRAFVASAGNEGSDFIHWGGFPLEQDSLWTYYYVPEEALFEDEEGSGLVGYVEFFGIISTADVAGTYIAMGVDRLRVRDFELTPLGYEGKTRWYSLEELIEEEFGVWEDLRYRSGRLAGEVGFAAQTLGREEVAVCITITDFVTSLDLDSGTVTGADLWRFMARGSGQIHVWSEGVWSAENEFVNLEVDDERYRPTDNRYTVGLPAVGSQIIAVGAYVNVADEADAFFNPNPTPAGALAAWSSRGPTTDGRIKPEIAAPGQNVFSVLSSAIDGQALEEELGGSLLAPGGKHMVLSGTSMSSPVAAGSIALYLQQHPTATNARIRDTFFKNAATDAFTAAAGSLPNSDWGFGKLDLFAVLTAAQEEPGPIPSACIPGDVNDDGRITLVDALFTL